MNVIYVTFQPWYSNSRTPRTGYIFCILYFSMDVLTDGSLDTSWGPTFNTILHSNSKPLVFNCCLFFLRHSLKYHHVDHYYVIKSWARDDCKLLLQQFLCSRTNAFSLAINSDVIYSTEDDVLLSSRVTQSLGRRVTAGVPFPHPYLIIRCVFKFESRALFSFHMLSYAFLLVPSVSLHLLSSPYFPTVAP